MNGAPFVTPARAVGNMALTWIYDRIKLWTESKLRCIQTLSRSLLAQTSANAELGRALKAVKNGTSRLTRAVLKQRKAFSFKDIGEMRTSSSMAPTGGLSPNNNPAEEA